MKKETPVAIRVNPHLKERCREVFRKLGMNTHAGVNLFLSQMVLYQKLPFDVALNEPSQKLITQEKTVALTVKTDELTKQKCAELAKKAGLNLSLAINMYLVQVVDKQAIPFEIISNEIGSEE
ncbi:MAG: hypothetical protein E7192_03560 [Erysipelotrichaceae bacterium]|nr:hypothetical protein [Erysipelotrichaceae bacterium]